MRFPGCEWIVARQGRNARVTKLPHARRRNDAARTPCFDYGQDRLRARAHPRAISSVVRDELRGHQVSSGDQAGSDASVGVTTCFSLNPSTPTEYRCEEPVEPASDL